MIPKLEESAAYGVVGFSVVQILSTYQSTAPKLADVRNAPPGDHSTAQLLLDADVFGGILVFIIGGTGAVLTRKMLPLVLAAAGLLMISLYYRSVAASPQPYSAAPAPEEAPA